MTIIRWKVVHNAEVPKKCVVVAAPHTSNWDFPITMAIARVTGVPIQWLGKAQMFNAVLGPFFRTLGGISVERSSPQGLVGDLAAEFNKRDELVVVVPAEGTRSAVDYWKSGFYRIAMEAGVPIQLAYVDRPTKSCGFGPVIHPTGDIKADMDVIRAFYEPFTGVRTGRFNVPRLREEDTVDVDNA